MDILGDKLCLKATQQVKELCIVESWESGQIQGDGLSSSPCEPSASPGKP